MIFRGVQSLLPRRVDPRRRQMARRNVRYRRTCSSARTGGRGSRLRTQTLVSVRLLSVIATSLLSVLIIRHVNAGEVGKLLGAKWKELDDSEKKVCCYSFLRSSVAHHSVFYSSFSHTSILLRRTKPAPKPRRLVVAYVPFPFRSFLQPNLLPSRPK